jgi:enterochelin esterase-like enzyme
MKFWKNPASLLNLLRPKTPPTVQTLTFQSFALNRDVQLDVYLPPDYDAETRHVYPLVLFNDGQDLPRMDFQGILAEQFSSKKLPPFIAVGIYTSNERQREYGTARQPDYKGRGDKAGTYTAFIIAELLPFLYRHYRLSDLSEDRAIAGFSLGGLSAFDIGWANPQIFGTIGVFSGALWWRWSHVKPEDPDADRIMHHIVQQTQVVDKNQYFWFQCGTLDEADDRNNNGVIDSIDDTLDLMKALRHKGFHEESMRYLEIEDGHHDPETWGKAMPDFLGWAFVDEGDY